MTASKTDGLNKTILSTPLHNKCNNFVIAIIGIPKRAPTPGVLAEMNWLDPRSRTQIRMIRQFKRLLNLDDYRLTKQVFLWDRQLNEAGMLKTWSYEVKEILLRNNMDFIYNSPYFSIKDTVEDLKKSLMRKDMIKWEADCRKMPKLRTFVQFKVFHQKTPYLAKPLSFIQRKQLAKFRLGVLALRIETGRYQRPKLPAEERLCKLCDSGEVEDESHFLLRCGLYSLERHGLISKLSDPVSFHLLSENDKMQFLMNDQESIKSTAQFIIDCFDKRSLHL